MNVETELISGARVKMMTTDETIEFTIKGTRADRDFLTQLVSLIELWEA